MFMTLSRPKISVVVPTYRRPEYLSRCLLALTTQVFDRDAYEIIVVSDGPDPEIQLVMMEYAHVKRPAIHFIALSERRGPAAARNTGWREAAGTWIAFTDDDCIPHEYWLANLCRDAQRLPENAPFALTGKTHVPISADPTDYERNVAHLETAGFITANCLCSRAALEETGGFDERFTMAWREDSDLQFNLIQHHIPIFHAPSARVTHPVRNRSWGTCLREEKKGIFNALLYKKYPRLYREHIERKPLWHYYVTVLSVALFITGLMANVPVMLWVGLAAWLLLTVRFTRLRLRHTSRTLSHMAEMFVTSAFIPLLSVYYRLYGAYRYKTLLL
jgi:GT2 family glycosyltransferase